MFYNLPALALVAFAFVLGLSAAQYEKTSACALGRLPWPCLRRACCRPASWVLPPPTHVEQELHACLSAGAVAMHCAPAWEVLGAPSWVMFPFMQ